MKTLIVSIGLTLTLILFCLPTDATDREWFYDRHSHVAKLDRALNKAPRRGWTMVSARRDWKTVYPKPSY